MTPTPQDQAAEARELDEIMRNQSRELVDELRRYAAEHDNDITSLAASTIEWLLTAPTMREPEAVSQAAEARRAEIADLIYDARVVDGLRGHAHVATGQAKGYMLDAADWIDAAKAELTRLTAENERYSSALENAGKTILDKGADVTRLTSDLAAREGYVLVPVEPTEAMYAAWMCSDGPWSVRYHELISSRPTPADFMLTRNYLSYGIRRLRPIPRSWDWWPLWLRKYWLFRNDIRLSRWEAIKVVWL